MIADLRTPAKYAPPVPRAVLYSGTMGLIALAGAIAFTALAKRTHNTVAFEVAAKQHAVRAAESEIAKLEADIANQAVAKMLRESNREWQKGTIPSAELQAKVMLALLESEEHVAKQLRTKDDAAGSKNAPRRLSSVGQVPFDLILRSLEVETNPQTGEARVTLELKLNRTDATALLNTTLSAQLSRIEAAGFGVPKIVPEVRSETVRLVATWRRV